MPLQLEDQEIGQRDGPRQELRHLDRIQKKTLKVARDEFATAGGETHASEESQQSREKDMLSFSSIPAWG